MIVHVPPQDSDRPPLTIGEFARRSRLSAKALRLYDDRGLLRPADVDRTNGYRYYSEDQVDVARLIGLLRGTGMSLNEIGEVLTAAGRSRQEATELLNRFLEELESTHSGRRLLIRHVHAILRKEHHSMFTINTRHVPAQRVMSIQRRLHGSETDAFVDEAKTAFATLLGESESDRPVHPDLPRRRRRRQRRTDRSDPRLPRRCPANRHRRGTDRTSSRRGVHDDHQGAMGLPSDPRRLRRSGVFA